MIAFKNSNFYGLSVTKPLVMIGSPGLQRLLGGHPVGCQKIRSTKIVKIEEVMRC